MHKSEAHKLPWTLGKSLSTSLDYSSPGDAEYVSLHNKSTVALTPSWSVGRPTSPLENNTSHFSYARALSHKPSQDRIPYKGTSEFISMYTKLNHFSLTAGNEHSISTSDPRNLGNIRSRYTWGSEWPGPSQWNGATNRERNEGWQDNQARQPGLFSIFFRQNIISLNYPVGHKYPLPASSLNCILRMPVSS